MEEKPYGKRVAKKYEFFSDKLRDESDRGSVIISAVILEDILQKMLKIRLISSVNKDDELFDSTYAPINNFSAKIDLAYRVGLIRPHIRSSLHLIRKTRNEFAHSLLSSGFEENSVKSRISELFKVNKNILDSMWKDLKEELSAVFKENKIEIKNPGNSIKSFIEVQGYRATFDLLAATTSAGLSVASENIDPIIPLKNEINK